MTSQTRGVLLVLLASLCLSTAPTAIKLGFAAEADPVTQLTFRLLIGALTLWIVFFLLDKSKLKIDRQGLFWCAVVGGSNTISLLSFYVAATLMDVSIAIVTFSAFPVSTLGLLALKGEKILGLHWVRIILAIVGVYLLVGPGGEVNPLGIGLVLITAMFYALHITLIQWRLSGYPSRTITVYILSFMALYYGIIYLLTGHTMPTLTPTGWGVVLWTAVLATAIARLAMFTGIRHIGSGQTALLGPLEVLLSIIWAVSILDERLSMIQWLGGALILISALLAAKQKRV
jgi:drug/metabolite transporter (DMT)-like permease